MEEKLAIYTCAKDDNGREHISYWEIELQAHQQKPELGDKGTLARFYIYNNITGKTEVTEAYEYITEVKKTGFWDKLFGRTEKIPQIQVFDSGTENFGPKADPTKPIVSFDITNDELFNILLLGTETPEGYGPFSNVDKYEESAKILTKLNEMKKQAEKNEANSKKDPVVVEETRPGKWNYYYNDGRGTVGGYTTDLPDQTLPGKNGDPDTVLKIKYTKPEVPKKEIPRTK